MPQSEEGPEAAGPKPRKLLEAFGDRKTLFAWGRDPRCIVNYGALVQRMRTGRWTLEDALTKPADPAVGARAAAIAARKKGDEKRQRIRELVRSGSPTLAALARELDTDVSSIHHHISVMPDAEAIKSKMRANRGAPATATRLTAFGVTKTLTEWLQDPRCAVSRNTLRKRLAERWPPNDALTTPGWLPKPDKPTSWQPSRPLRPRELQILQAISRGLGSREIAQELGITFDTARDYRKELYRVLGARSEGHAVAIAYEAGILGPRAEAAE